MFSRTYKLRRNIIFTFVIFLALVVVPLIKVPVVAADENARTRVVMLLGSEGFLMPLVDAYDKLGDYPIDLKLFNSNDLANEEKVQQLKQSLQDADVFLLEMIGSTGIQTIGPLLQDLPEGWEGKVLSTRSGSFQEYPQIDDSQDSLLTNYFKFGGVENMRQLVLHLASTYGQVATEEQLDPINMPGRFIYHPDAEGLTLNVEDGMGLPPGTFDTLGGYLAWYKVSGHFKEGAPSVGITTYDSFFKNNDIDMFLAVQRELEAKGANALLVFSDSSNRKAAFQDFFMPGGKRQVDFLIAAVGFNFIYGQPEEGIELFKQLNVPVMAPVYSSDLEEWQSNPAGISSEVAWQIAYPELDGRIEPVFMGGSTVVKVDESTGATIVKKVPLPDRIERLVGRALAWVNLQQKDNTDKKIALVYYNHHGGKDDIGASYLNSIASAAVILQALRDNDYRVEGDLSSRVIEELIHRQGRNVGSWAPGELDALVQAGALLLPVEKYLEWYATLSGELRAQVEKEWGPPPGNIMVYEGNLVIPGATLGNIFLGPQPMRGWGDDPSKIAHSPALPPPHQYIAFYFWLQKEFQADAVIHLGTHGTLEWLPGRSVGLGEDDWPDVLMGNLPDIYPYIMNNPGEGTQAKRRGYAVTIDHLTPPMIQPGLYGALAELQQLVVDYENAVSVGNTARASNLQEQIIEKVKANSLDRDLSLDLETADFAQVASLLHEYLEELATELMPYGLHTFGLPPQGEMLDLMVESIVNYDAVAREESRDEIRECLLLTTNEITNLLRALSGAFIEPGLGRDPVRVPDALPTGRNMVSFDPRMVPDEAAWKTGKEAADQLLEKFYAEQGRYPETVGVVLWAIETMRTQGESVALILRLIGAEPVWDKSGRVSTVQVTPLEELGRPRINVLVTISGLFRDTFSHTVGVLDDAFRQVALLEENPESNLVRKTYLTLRDKLREQGLSEQEADDLAQARIFGDAPGTYGTGVSELGQATSAWEDSQDLVDTYMSRMSYIYGKTAYGVPAQDTFREILKSVDLVTQVRDSLWGALDNDDVAQYLGGLKLAAEAASGNKVQTYMVNTRTGSPRVQTFSEFVGTELRSRLLNPKWIEGMLKEGYAGSREIGNHVANMFLVDATLEGIDDWAWRQVAETFVFDDKIMSQLDPFVLQSIIGWNLEAARRQMWQADQETLTKLADTYMQTAAQYGVVCCHHTCSNIVFNEWLASYATVDSDTMDKFKEVFYTSTDQQLNIAPKQNQDQDHDASPLSSSPSRNASPEPAEQVEPIQPAPQSKLPSGAGAAPTQTRQLAQSATPVGDKPAQHNTQLNIRTETQQSAPQETEKPEQGQKNVKAYELKEESAHQSSSAGTKAVSFMALLAAFGLVATFIKGYISK